MHTWAIKTDGTLWAWGSRAYGILGQNSEGSWELGTFSSPVQIPGTTWNQIVTSNYTALATKTDGTLWAWGYGGLGNIGNDSILAEHHNYFSLCVCHFLSNAKEKCCSKI